MKIQVNMSEPKAVYVAPVNEATEKWGVCAIPVMFRLPDGRLMVRVNGGQDTSFAEKFQQSRDFFFVSADEGESWTPAGPEVWDESTWVTVDPLYVPLREGGRVAFRWRAPREIGPEVPEQKKVLVAGDETEWSVYRLGDLPKESYALETVRYDARGRETESVPCRLDVPELLVSVISGSQYRDGKEILIPEYVPQPKLPNPLITAPHVALQLPDGTLLALVVSETEEARRYAWQRVIVLESGDLGRSWQKRGEISQPDPTLLFGYTYENSMTRAADGSLLVVMRTEHCVPKDVEPFTGLMFSRSEDEGRTWSKPVPISDSSVTPHITTLANGLTVLVYGRPGVHALATADGGRSWQGPFPVIGRTLREHLAAGEDYMDAKYWQMETYANTCMEIVSEDTVLLCYNDMRYQTGDGLNHKATLVRKLRFTAEE